MIFKLVVEEGTRFLETKIDFTSQGLPGEMIEKQESWAMVILLCDFWFD